MEGNIVGQILLQLILIALNAIFASAEIAVLSFSDNRLAKLAAQGNKKAVRLARLTSQPARFLATIQVAITLSGFMGSAFAADNFASLLCGALAGLNLPIPLATLNSISVVAITLILSYITLVFGELVPKRVAMKNAETLALGLSALIFVISRIFKPVVSLLTASTNGVLRLLGIDPNSADDVITEEEIRMMVDAGSIKGAIDIDEQVFIQNVFEFDDLTVGEICTHRTDVTMLWMDESIEQWEKTIYETAHSIFPICEESVDNVIGVLISKDYFRLRDRSLDSVMEHAVKRPYFVPEHIKADVLFKNMKRKRNYFAIVSDEYGGVQGIITISDLIEQLVGDFSADGDEEEAPDIETVREGVWRIRGSAPIEDVEQALGVKFPEDEYETFGGFVFTEVGSVPDDGSSIELNANGLHIKTLEIREHRLVSAIAAKQAGDAERDG